jgi:hypothetical protein
MHRPPRPARKQSHARQLPYRRIQIPPPSQKEGSSFDGFSPRLMPTQAEADRASRARRGGQVKDALTRRSGPVLRHGPDRFGLGWMVSVEA